MIDRERKGTYGKLYDLKKYKARLFIIRAAKQQGMAELETLVRREINREDWMHQELRNLNMAQDHGPQFWDLDLNPTAKDMNCVSIGRYTKGAVNGFLFAYGDVSYF